jgi:hypothetical protein
VAGRWTAPSMDAHGTCQLRSYGFRIAVRAYLSFSVDSFSFRFDVMNLELLLSQ